MDYTFTHLLLGKDLRTIRKNNVIIELVEDQQSFDELFSLVFHHERTLVMRAADAVEKITRKHPDYLIAHKNQLLALLQSSDHKELKWHLAQLITRTRLSIEELDTVWNSLKYWVLNPNESKIVRVNALQGLYDLTIKHVSFKEDFNTIMHSLEHDQIPSLQARIRKLRKNVI